MNHEQCDAVSNDATTAAAHVSTDSTHSLDIPTEVFEEKLTINTTSAFVAAREAVAGFKKLEGPKTFLYTGNATNEGALPGFLVLGVGKNATAHMVELLDKEYKDQDIKSVFAFPFERR